jgi:hypothetical protein
VDWALSLVRKARLFSYLAVAGAGSCLDQIVPDPESQQLAVDMNIVGATGRPHFTSELSR